jgi:hypothetical protein
MQLTRRLLYLLLWRYPATSVADELHISSSALKKVCRTHQIPTPGRGYWRKREVGEPAPVPEPLPEPERDEALPYEVGGAMAEMLERLELSSSSSAEWSSDAATNEGLRDELEFAPTQDAGLTAKSPGVKSESHETGANASDLLAPDADVVISLARRHRELDDAVLFFAALELALVPQDPATQAVVRLWVERARASLPCGPISEVLEMCRVAAHGEDLPRWWPSVPRVNSQPRCGCCTQVGRGAGCRNCPTFQNATSWT